MLHEVFFWLLMAWQFLTNKCHWHACINPDCLCKIGANTITLLLEGYYPVPVIDAVQAVPSLRDSLKPISLSLLKWSNWTVNNSKQISDKSVLPSIIQLALG